MFTIYVLPTEEGLPPRAVLIPLAISEPGEPMVALGLPVAVAYEDECWRIDGEPVPEDANEAITQHAESLGVVL